MKFRSIIPVQALSKAAKKPHPLNFEVITNHYTVPQVEINMKL